MLAGILDLWLPLLLAPVFVFFVSSLLHMVLPIHRSDSSKLPGEEEVLASLRERSIPPGDYMFPRPDSMAELQTEECKARYKAGPVGFMTVLPSGVPNIGRSLGQWFLYSVLVTVVTALVVQEARGGMSTASRFQVAFLTSFGIYGLAYIPDSIWKGLKWSTSYKFMIDGALYGLATGAAFHWFH